MCNSKLLSRNLPPLILIGSKRAPTVYNASFIKFLHKLKYKCSETNTKLIIKPEYNISKTCLTPCKARRLLWKH